MEGKYICHVPIEQYGFISVEIEGTAEDAHEAYQELSHAKGDGTGITSKEFNDWLDCYLNTGHAPDGGLPAWEEMSLEQKKIINHVKLAFKRINKN